MVGPAKDKHQATTERYFKHRSNARNEQSKQAGVHALRKPMIVNILVTANRLTYILDCKKCLSRFHLPHNIQ